MIGRMIHTVPFRLIALVLATVLMVVVATPAKAEAIDALTIVAIAGLAVAVIVIVAYLVVANVEGKSADSGRMIWVACAGDECTQVPAAAVAELAATAVAPVDRQGP
jgi:amino acid transporter